MKAESFNRNDHGGSADPYHIVLLPNEKGIHLHLRELWDYRDLIFLMTRKTFTITYQQTLLGPLWILINPILSSLLYVFLFGHVANIGTAGIPRILFYFVSSAIWELFSFSLTSNSSTFITNAYLFSKVYFPRLVMPVSNMFVSIMKFGVQVLIIAAAMAVYLMRGMIHPRWALFPLLPFLLLQMAVLGMGVGILVSSFTTRYRDLLALVQLGVSLWMYASPVVYPMAEIRPGVLKTILKINPVTELMELIRLILLGEGEFDPAFYLLGLGITVLMLVAGAAIFNRVERTFADTV